MRGHVMRPKGSRNQDKTEVELTQELIRIQKLVQKQLVVLQVIVPITNWFWMAIFAITMRSR
jgi:hypothetical protein